MSNFTTSIKVHLSKKNKYQWICFAELNKWFPKLQWKHKQQYLKHLKLQALKQSRTGTKKARQINEKKWNLSLKAQPNNMEIYYMIKGSLQTVKEGRIYVISSFGVTRIT